MTLSPPRTPFTRAERLERLDGLLRERILVLDGAMGTLLQRHQLSEEDFRGERFADHPKDLRGNNDLLSLTQPDIVRDSIAAYFAAGADIVSTNTFTSTRIAQADYGLAHIAGEINEAGARLAREAADEAEAGEGSRDTSAGRWGRPTGPARSRRRQRPRARNVSFEELVEAYHEAAEGQIAGGADILLVETMFDTLNAKAAIFGIEAAFDALGVRLPLVVSGTITDASGRTLSGQTVEAFWTASATREPLLVGLNCALGAKQLREHVEELAGSPTCRSRLPERRPAQRARRLRRDARGDGGRARRVGAGRPRQRRRRRAAGPRPSTRRAIAEAVAGIPPRVIPERRAGHPPVRPRAARRSRCPAARSSTSASGRTSPARASSRG